MSVKNVIKEYCKNLDKNFDNPFCLLSSDLDITESVVRGGEVSI